MYLIYINELGKDYKGQKQYEFIFGKEIDIIVEEWYIIPSSERSKPPEIINIDLVGLLKNSDLVLELVQNSDYFGVIDAVDGVIALGWEPFYNESEERLERLFFRYGETVDSVTEKLSSRELKLIKEEVKYKYK